jgi:hypothetical protein
VVLQADHQIVALYLDCRFAGRTGIRVVGSIPIKFPQRELADLAAETLVGRLSPVALYLLERRLVDSLTTVIIPFDNRVFFVRLLNCAAESGMGAGAA